MTTGTRRGRRVHPSVRGTQVRTDLKPLHITQPEGVSFTVEGAELKWQNWTMRLGFNYREGPVIYQVTFDDRGTVRDIAYRLSFAEMIVPYRDPTFDHYRRTAYDIGEWGLGVMTRSLELGCDCLGEVAYLDATLCDSKGDPYDIPHAICLHEEDNAVLWKHVDPHTGAEVRRQRRMVVSSPRIRGQLRVPHLLAVLPGRQYRVRGAGHRSDGHDPVSRRRTAPAVRNGRGHEHLCAVPPALPDRATRPGHRRRPTR
jgi:Cu2+-containing amine oxidase